MAITEGIRMPLQTRNVFIDTEFFVKSGLDFSSKTIESFRDICGRGELSHITSTIVVREVKRKISEHINEAINGVKSFRRKAKILASSENDVVKNFFRKFDYSEIEAHAIKVFDDFLDESSTRIVDLTEVDGNEVVDMYFAQVAPFQDGKKKNEFPDAFTMLAVRSALRWQEEIYVVSEDKDLVAFCEGNPRFIHIESLSRLLDLYNTHDEKRSGFIKNYISEREGDIKETIISQIEDADAYNSSTWEDAEVDNFSITGISDLDPSIIYIDDEGCQLVCDVEVEYSVTVIGPDYNNGMYDREDGVVYTFDDSTRVDEGRLEFTVEIHLYYGVDGGEFTIQDMEINVLGLSGGIEFSVEENASENYW
ncbi:PIN domain-containing protein [Pseudomonas aeruginosa]|uniref:PIN domain-containing protein n=1 Tax=Pseudomonas aeruginosa TaxID=287 RepID=UPI003F51C7D4|nr:PIN domain-containing protein [Pseudomonas aeruginosa]MCS8395967.1 PIN domain-containing protein [Pseudomonas aeruginosa]MCS8769852.1 PIN domain-containing protein [Pseudomonas aeruginosa]MCS9735219.1 PIN domain-containing protein [Pseudomonas aeruginosa]MCT0279663.1 PIN domain-containing protein [Pseudomonas aeruginosa]